jgi:glycosyltransferase involved in cell wall biosynthesis
MPVLSTSRPKVSVVLTSYNREKYIAASIESVLSQTFEDFELLIVDDCSQDRSAEIARSYCSDPRVHVYVNERNLRQFPNRNYAASLARGEFLKFHDSDDVMYPHCLEVMVKGLDAEPTAAFAVSYFKRWIGGPCPTLSTPLLTYQRDLLGAEGIMWVSPGQVMFRTERFREPGGFPDEGAFSDSLFFVRACARVDIVLVPADLFWYRAHQGQEPFGAADLGKRCAAMWRELNQPGCPLTGRELQQARKNWCWRVARYAVSATLEGRWGDGFAIASGSGISASEWVRYLRKPKRSDAAGVPVDEDGDPTVPEWPDLKAVSKD